MPNSPNADDISDGLLKFLSDKGGIDQLILVGCDGTVVNIGYKGGAIRKIEEKMNRSVQWVICLIQFNELPFRALFQNFDGKKTGLNNLPVPLEND